MSAWCRWTAVTTSKLLPDYNLPVLTSSPFETCRPSAKIYCWSHSVQLSPLEAEKASCWFPPQCLSLTLMSCLPWNSISPGARITDIPPRCSGEAAAKVGMGWKEKPCWCSDSFCIFDCASHTFLVLLLVAVTHLDRHNLDVEHTHSKLNWNALNIIEKSDKQEDLHLNSQGHWQTSAAYGSL